MNFLRIAMLATLLLVAATTTTAEPIQWTVAEGGNNHFYELVVRPNSSIGWHEADREVATMQLQGVVGHLATITSLEEQEFIASHFADPPNIYIGGYQDLAAPDYVEPAGGWRWVTGEAWDYTNWRVGEPNDCWCVGFPEDFLHVGGSAWPKWNDNHDAELSGFMGFDGFLIEFPIGVPEPATTTLCVLGAAACWVGAEMRTKLCRTATAGVR